MAGIEREQDVFGLASSHKTAQIVIAQPCLAVVVVQIPIGWNQEATFCRCVVVAVHGKEEQHLVIGRQAVVVGFYFGEDGRFAGVRHRLASKAEIGFEFGFKLDGFGGGFGEFGPAGLEVGDVEEDGVVLAGSLGGGEGCEKGEEGE